MKHKFRSCAALLMALYMIFSLAACGQSGSTGSDTKQTGTKNTEPTPEFVYSAIFTKLRENIMILGVKMVRYPARSTKSTSNERRRTMSLSYMLSSVA